MPRRRALLLLCLLLPLLTATSALAQAVIAFKASGDATQSFIAATFRQPAGMTGFSAPTPPIDRTQITRRGSSDKEWQFYAAVDGLIADVTVHRGQLLLLMENGSWRSVYEGGSSSGEPLPPQTPGKLVLLAGEGPALLGYVRESSGHGQLVRRETGTWADLGPGPDVPEPAVADLAVFADRAYLSVSRGDGTLQLWRTDPLRPLAPATRPATHPATRTAALLPATLAPTTQPLPWKYLGVVNAGLPLGGTRLLPLGNDLTKDIGVWADPGERDGGVVYRWRGGETWERAFSLGPVNGELAASLGTLRFYSGPGASNAPGATRPAADPKADSKARTEPTSYEYAVGYDGKFLGKPVTIDDPAAVKLVRDLGDLIVGMATAGLMLSIVVWWRKREFWTVEVVAAAQALPLAPVGRRLLSGIIDVLPWLAALGYLFYRDAIIVEIPPFRTRESVFLLLYAYATVLTHTTICEVIFGRTLGMLIAGLRVTDMKGHRATPGAILIRNLCRAVDMVLVAPYLAVFTSPLNQSLGDAAAGTLVLTRDSTNISPSSPASGSDEKP